MNSELTAALIGGIVRSGLTGTLSAIGSRVIRVHTSQALAQAFFEELSAVEFGDIGFAGFTSQVFDSQFDKLFTLPATLRQALMRYHWRMKYLAANPIAPLRVMTVDQAARRLELHDLWAGWIVDVQAQRDALLPRLRWYFEVPAPTLFWDGAETRMHLDGYVDRQN